METLSRDVHRVTVDRASFRHVTVHHCNVARSRDHPSLEVSLLIGVNLRCVATVLIIKNATVSKSQNVKNRSHANKYLIKVNIRTKVGIRISTYSNADIACYSTTWPMELNDVRLIVDGS